MFVDNKTTTVNYDLPTAVADAAMGTPSSCREAPV